MLLINDHNLPIYTVSELSYTLKKTVEDYFSFVRVKGEISGFKKVTSGHLYFALKDSESVLDAVCWRGNGTKLSVMPEDGLEVICTGKLTTYPGRSKYQIIVDSIELAGQGALLALLEKRKQKLLEEGLFDSSRKKPLPFLPNLIGVITSPTGAVIRDILHRLEDRFPSHVLIWPTLVQGEGAALQIANAIQGFNKLSAESGKRPDLLILARGGGSLEDLWTFNEEIVVRAVAFSQIPIITAIGHETDTTLVDFVADRRAPTPTAAAEIAVPVRSQLMKQIISYQFRLHNMLKRQVKEKLLFLNDFKHALTKHENFLAEKAQKIDDLYEHLEKNIRFLIDRQKFRYLSTSSKLRHPEKQLSIFATKLETHEHKLKNAYQIFMTKNENQLLQLSQALKNKKLKEKNEEQLQKIIFLKDQLQKSLKRIVDQKTDLCAQRESLLKSYSYERTLERGFVIVQNDKNETIVSSKNIQENQNLRLRFKDGCIKVKTL